MTKQQTDILYYENKKYRVFRDILESYFGQFPQRKFRTEFLITSLWRGYFAEFEIVNQELYIRSLRRYTGFDKVKTEMLTEDITRKSFPETLKLDFFSGYICISSHEQEQGYDLFILLNIEHGNLIGELQINGEAFRKLEESGAAIF